MIIQFFWQNLLVKKTLGVPALNHLDVGSKLLGNSNEFLVLL